MDLDRVIFFWEKLGFLLEGRFGYLSIYINLILFMFMWDKDEINSLRFDKGGVI